MSPERALATIDVGAIERNCARLPKPLCAVVKADGYGHGAGAAAQAALRGGAEWLAVATADEAAALRALEIDTPILVMGALAPARAAGGARRAGRRGGLERRGGRGRAARPREARHRHGPARHQGPRAGAAAGRARQRGGGDDPLRHGRRARGRPVRGPARGLRALRGRRGPRRPRGARRQQRRHPARAAHALRPRALRHSDLRDGSVPRRPRRARARARARAALLGGGGAPLRRRRLGRLRPALDRAASRPGWPPCRSATATAGGAR